MFGANVLRGPDQIPWDGKLNYDYQLWIDSDIVFSTEKFLQSADSRTLPLMQLMRRVKQLKERIIQSQVGIQLKMVVPPLSTLVGRRRLP